MQENNFDKNLLETPKSHASPQGSVKDTKNSKRKKKLIIISSVLAIFITVFFLFILPALASAYEENYSRSITIKQAGGSGASGSWVVIVDRDATSALGSTNPNAKKGVIIKEDNFKISKGRYFDDKQHVAHSWKGPLTGHQSVRTDGTAFTESLDCVGVTPHIRIKAPTRKGYDFAGWKVSFTNGQLSTGGASVTFSTPVSYTLKSSHTTPESAGDGIYSYYKDGYYYISAGCYEPGSGGYYGKNMVITALWTPHKYKISYTLNNGAYGAKHPTSATYGKEITISNPTRRGYSFGGWTITGYDNTTAIVFDERHRGMTWKEEFNEIFKNLTPTKNATVKFEAVWQPNVYNIKYVPNGGQLGNSAPEMAEYTETVIIDNPTRTNYVFTGWTITNYTSGARVNGSEYTGSTWKNEKSTKFSRLNCNEGKTVTFTANWTPVYKITYNLNGGTNATAPTKATYGKSVTISNPSRAGYTFAGWKITNYNLNTAMVGSTKHTSSTWENEKGTSFKNLRNDTNTVTFTAKWTKIPANTQTVTVYYVDSFSGSDVIVKTEETVVKNVNGNKYITVSCSLDDQTGYNFSGWNIYEGTSNGNSWWTRERVGAPTQKFAYPGKSIGVQAFNVETRFSGSLNDRYKEMSSGYLDFIDNERTIKVSSDTTFFYFFSVWNATDYKLTFDPNGGINHSTYPSSGYTFRLGCKTSVANNGKIEFDSDGNLASGKLPTRDNYKFVGWFDTLEAANNPLAASSLEHKIFDSEGYNMYVGKYWDYNPDGVIVWNYPGDVTLYAGWKNQTYTLTLDPNGGTNSPSYTGPFTMTLNNNDNENISGCTPAREGYKFLGWANYTSEGAANEASGMSYAMVYDENGEAIGDGYYWVDDTPEGDVRTRRWIYEDNITLYAQWEENVCAYEVHHFFMDLDGNYIEDTSRLIEDTGFYNTKVTGDTDNDDEDTFITPATQTITLDLDSSKNVINYYYERRKADYKVYHNYLETDLTTYYTDISATVKGTAYVGASYTAGHKNKEGFSATEAEKTIVIKRNSNDNIVDYYYDRNKYGYTVEHYYMNSDGRTYTRDDNLTYKGSAFYGTEVSGTREPKEGYVTPEKKTITIGAGVNKIIYNYDRNKYDYTVEHYYMNLDGTTYTKDVDATATGSAYFNTSFTGELAPKTGFTSPEKQTITISSNSSDNIIKYYYTRNKYDYTVEHYYMNTDGSNYTIDNDVTFSGTAYYGASVTGNLVSKAGFTSPAQKSIIIDADSTKNVIKYYYTRNKYDYTVEHYYMNLDGEGYTKDTDVTATGSAYYGSEVTGELVSKTGFTSPNKKTITISVNSSNNVIKYYYTRNKYDYTVEHYYMNTDGTNYTLDDGVTVTGTAYYNSEVTGELAPKTGFTSPNKKTITISANSSNNVIKYYYTRNKYDYTVEHYYMNVDGNNYTINNDVTASGTAYYGSEVTGELAPKTGFTSPNKQTIIISANSSNNIIKYYYTRNKYDYTVEHYYMNLDGEGYTKDADATATGSAYYGSEVTGELVSKTGFILPEKQTITISVNSSENVIKYYYDRASYTVRLYPDKPANASASIENKNPSSWAWDGINKCYSKKVFYGETYLLPETKDTYALTGWTSSGWYKGDEFIGTGSKEWNLSSSDRTVIELKPKWKANTYTVKLLPNKPSSASSDIQRNSLADWNWNIIEKCYTATFTYDSLNSLPSISSPYSLTGWSVDKGWFNGDTNVGSGLKRWNLTAEDNGTAVLSLTWVPNSYTVRLYENRPGDATNDVEHKSPNGWTWNSSLGCYESSFKYDETNTIPSLSEVFALKGWKTKDPCWSYILPGNSVENLSNGGTQIWNLAASSGAVVNFNARFEAIKYTAILHPNKPDKASSTIENLLADGTDGWVYNVEKDGYIKEFTYDKEELIPVLENTYALQGWHITDGWYSKATDDISKAVWETMTGVNIGSGSTTKWNLTTIEGAELDLYLDWEAYIYTLNFNYNVGALNYNSETEANLIVNGSKQDIERSREVSYDDKVGDLPLPSIAGGIFIEWNDKQDGSGNTYTKDTFYRVAGDTTIYAQYKIITANMQINSNYRNGDENKSFTVNNLRAIDKYKFMHATRQYGFGLVNPQDATRSYTDSLYNYVEAEKAYITDNANTYSCVGYNADKESHYDNNFTHKMNDNVSVLDLMYEYQALYNLENGAAAKTTFAEEYAYIKSNNLLNVDGKTFIVNAIWDAYPTVEVLPKSILQTDLAAMNIQEFEAKLKSFIKVTDSKPYATGDDEDGIYSDTNTKVSVSFPELSADKESLETLQSTGSASVTYCITDMVGNKTYNIVDIPVISQNPTKNYVARVDYYTRVINEQFYNERDRYIANGVPYTIEESRRSGGLLPASKWYLDPDYRNLLTSAFETLRTDNEDGYVQIWKFNHEDVLAVQQYIKDNGIGNSKSDTALKNFCEQFAYCRKK